MRKFLLAVLATALSAAMLLAAGAAKGKSWTGTVSDAMCGKKHGMGGMSDKDCTLACVKKGGKYALVVGDKVYTMEGRTDGLAEHAGGKAKVTGTLSGDTITVESVSAPAAGKKAPSKKKG